MPYKRTGAMKISDHHVRSPLLNIDKACQTCHKWNEDELRNRVHTIQDRTYQLRNMALDATLQLTRAIGERARTDSAGANVRAARGYQRKAQFLTDFIEAENSMGFHAGQEAARILANAINYARLGQAALRGERLPDIAGPRRAPEQVVSPGTAPGTR
jgi:nitrite reductase (cytochrome c-552)